MLYTTVYRVTLNCHPSNEESFHVVLKTDVDARYPRCSQDLQRKARNYQVDLVNLQGVIIPIGYGPFSSHDLR